MAVRTFFVSSPFIFLHHGGGHNTGRYRNDSVTDQHDASRKKLSQSGDRSYISVSYGSHRDNGPINAVRDVVELGVGLCSFNHIHQRADGSHQDDDK